MTASGLADRITSRAGLAGVSVSRELASHLGSYLGLLAKWNSKINLTSLALEPPSDEALDRLLVEPLVVAGLVSASAVPGGRLVIDIGSGGGSPAVPVKLARPLDRFVLVESNVRKAAFLRETVRQLGLQGVEIANCRFEEFLLKPDFSEAADLVTLRAVKIDGRIWEGIRTVLKPGGQLVLFRGPGQRLLADIPPPFRVERTETIEPSGTQVTVVSRPA